MGIFSKLGWPLGKQESTKENPKIVAFKAKMHLSDRAEPINIEVKFSDNISDCVEKEGRMYSEKADSYIAKWIGSIATVGICHDNTWLNPNIITRIEIGEYILEENQ